MIQGMFQPKFLSADETEIRILVWKISSQIILMFIGITQPCMENETTEKQYEIGVLKNKKTTK